MRFLLHIKKNSAKISLLLLAAAITSCNSLKRVDDYELLIKKNSITADDEKVIDQDLESLIIQKPNSSLLGYPLRLNLYNLAKPNPDSSFQNWLHRKEKREKRLHRFLSKKQTQRLGESFLVKGMSRWLKNIGEPPSILDTTKTRKSLERLKAYYSSKGYLNTTTSYRIDSLKRKQRVKVNYNITKGEPYIIDVLTHNISSIAIDSLYTINKKKSFVEVGKKFDYSDFSKERNRLTKVFKNNGIYNFQESAITYDLVRDSTKASEDKKMEVQLNISDLKIRGDSIATTAPYNVYKFDKINIYTDYFSNGNEGQLQFNRYKNYSIFYRNKLRFKPQTLADAVFFTKDSIYRDINKIRTYRQITNLNVFKYPTITFVEDSTKTYLTANVYLTSKPKYSFRTNLDVTYSNIQTVGLAFSPSLQVRNLFKGAENLSISGRLNIGSSSDELIVSRQFFNLLEFGADINLDFPRIWFPFLNTTKFIPNYMLPRTRVSIGGSAQENIGLDKQTLNSVIGYNWTPSDLTKHNIELLNVQYVRNVNPDRFFNVYRNTYDRLNEIADNFDEASDFNTISDFATAERFFELPENSNNPVLRINNTDPNTRNDAKGFIDAILKNQITATTQQRDSVNRIEERRIRLTENNLIFATNYSFNKNNRKGPTDNNFYQFRFKLESAGNLLSVVSKIFPFSENEEGDLLIFDVPYSQYIKTEFDYVKYWQLPHSNVLAFRSFFGIAIPYGNSDNIPFVRSYFAGGANDNRAWRPYSLGPGSTNAANDFNEANFKIALNLEYRFLIAGSLKGALFADAGNIWNIFDNVDDPDATFNNISSLKDIALGSGFGLRYDFNYFVVRADLGFKTYNPAEEISKRWFRDYNFSNSVLQIGINYPF